MSAISNLVINYFMYRIFNKLIIKKNKLKKNICKLLKVFWHVLSSWLNEQNKDFSLL